ncbi:hypothetical protein CR513_10775, partial [Mucuna pruriens]
MKQLATSNLEFQQSVSSSNLQFQQNMTATIQDLKMQIGQLANTVSELQSAGSSSLPSQTILNLRRNANVPQPAEADSEAIADSQSHPQTTVLPKKCRDPGIFFVPCTIGDCTFANAMLDLGASINVMPASTYRSLNFRDLEPTGMTIQLANRSIVQPLGVLEDVLVQVNELIFPADFYVLDMEDESSGKGSTLILGRPFLMTARTKIDVHAGTLSMEFGDTLVQFNIFEAMKHPTEDHSLFGIDIMEELVEEYFQLDSCSAKVEDQQAGQTDPKPIIEKSPSPPPMELKPLPSHLKYAFLDSEQQLPVIIASNLLSEQEDKLLEVLRQHKQAIGWKLSDLPGINPSICMHRILMEEDIKPIRQQQRRLNPTILDVVKKEVTKLLAAGIIYPISDSQWVSPVQVVPKKSGMTVMKNQQDELVPTRIQNSWRVCIDYRRLNQATHKDHFPLPFIDQMLEKIAGKSHYYFLNGFSGYMKIHIAPKDQHKTTFTCPFGTFAYTRMPFGLCNAPSTFQRCMMSIFSDLLQDCMEVFMDDFTVYAESFDACLNNLSKVNKNSSSNSDNNIYVTNNSNSFKYSSANISIFDINKSQGLEQMENNDQILKELATPDVVYQPWCIQYPQLELAQTYELKSGLIHLLPKFHGLAGENTHKHLKEFHMVCSTMRPQGISEDYIKMKAFPFSLNGATKDWLYLQPVLFNTWGR